MHFDRAAASRTFWTAGRRRPIRMAMMAITTSNSISVNPCRPCGDETERCMRVLLTRDNQRRGGGGILAQLWRRGVRRASKKVGAPAVLRIGRTPYTHRDAPAPPPGTESRAMTSDNRSQKFVYCFGEGRAEGGGEILDL